MANRFWVGGTGTWDGAGTTHWASTTGGAGGQSVPGTGDAAVFDASSGGGTVTVNTTVAVQSITMGAFTGTLDFSANNNNVTCSVNFSCTGTGARTLNMGNGTWTLSTNSASTLWDLTTVTNLTFNANSSTLIFSGTSSAGSMTIQTGGKSYNVVSFTGQTSGRYYVVNGGPTIATFNLTNPPNILFAANTTTTITNAFTWTGSSSLPFIIASTNTNITATIVATGGGTLDYACLAFIAFNTGTVNATNSQDCRGTSGVTITAPSGGVTARVIGG